MRRRRLSLLTVLLVLAIVGFGSFYRSRHSLPHATLVVIPIPAGRNHSYSTTFPLTENPLSENGRWLDGKVVGVVWSSVATVHGFAYGTEPGGGRGDESYDDSAALLTGAWSADQTVEAQVHTVNPSDHAFEEVELRLRSSLAPRFATGYEVLFRCSKTSKAYASIARWDGPIGKFTYLSQKFGSQYGVGEGDLVEATIVGNVITAYINGVPVMSAIDSTFSSGSPGIGFWLQRPTGIRSWLTNMMVTNSDFGFSSMAAWD
jgi:hypothetical protein